MAVTSREGSARDDEFARETGTYSREAQPSVRERRAGQNTMHSPITFRPLAESDIPRLASWLAEDHVRRWWRSYESLDDVADKYEPRIHGLEPTEVFIVSLATTPVGMIQRYRIVDHPDTFAAVQRTGFDRTRSIGIDYLIGEPSVVGCGVGSRMIATFTGRTLAEHGMASNVIATPQLANTASCRVLARADFVLEWIGHLDTEDPVDEGTSALYVHPRGTPTASVSRPDAG